MKFEHYYTKKPTSALKYYNIKAKLRGFLVDLTTSTGVFSSKRVDSATRLLIENMKVNPEEEFLDLGCGYGVIGVIAAKLGAEVTMSDVNERAVMLAKKNVRKNKVRARVLVDNGVPDGDFDNIVLNPPIAAGMETCKRLIKESHTSLKKKGLLQLVARHKKGGSRLQDYMKKLFKNARTITKKGGFRVYVSERE